MNKLNLPCASFIIWREMSVCAIGPKSKFALPGCERHKLCVRELALWSFCLHTRAAVRPETISQTPTETPTERAGAKCGCRDGARTAENSFTHSLGAKNNCAHITLCVRCGLLSFYSRDTPAASVIRFSIAFVLLLARDTHVRSRGCKISYVCISLHLCSNLAG